MGRMATPLEIANVALLLLSDASSAMTGSICVVDCGITLSGGFYLAEICQLSLNSVFGHLKKNVKKCDERMDSVTYESNEKISTKIMEINKK